MSNLQQPRMKLSSGYSSCPSKQSGDSARDGENDNYEFVTENTDLSAAFNEHVLKKPARQGTK